MTGGTFQAAIEIVALAVITIGVLQSLLYAVQLAVAGVALSQRPPLPRLGMLWERYADVAPPVSVLVPAFNEERSIIDSVRSILSLQYPGLQVVVVSDGSTDGTVERLVSAFGMSESDTLPQPALPHEAVTATYTSDIESRLVVVDKANGGKSDALNCAITYARSPLVCTIDADSILEADALLRAVAPFIEDPERTVAVGATIRVANGCRIVGGRVVEIGVPRKALPLFQTIEYLRAFLMARLAWSRIGALTIVSGAFGLFRRNIVVEVGGYSTGTVGEDFELIIKLHRHLIDKKQDYRIAYIPEPVCWTEVPESLGQLGKQRSRWHRGAMETFFKHRKMLLNPRYGRVGTLGFLNMLLVDVLSPIAELLGYLIIPLAWATGILSLDYFLAFTALTFAFGIFISAGALVMEEVELRRFPRARDLRVLFVASVLENIGYRQINNFWRVRGMIQFIGRRRGWGHLDRKGFGSA